MDAEKKTVHIGFRASPAFSRKAHAHAKQRGLRLSELLRVLLERDMSQARVVDRD